jgi:orotate phosphoribosyltransferase
MQAHPLPSALLELFSAQSGHFLLESGHHGERWLDLELLCHRPDKVQPFAAELARRLASFDFEILCGPLIEGAFVGLMVAEPLGCRFAYSERFAQASADGLFPAAYRVPRTLRRTLPGKRVALVNDVINAGSAVKATFADLQACGAQVVAIASLLVLGDSAAQFAQLNHVPLLSLAALPNQLWTPESCPLCAAGVPLQDLEDFAVLLAKNASGSSNPQRAPAPHQPNSI